MRTRLPLLPPLQERVDHPVMRRTKRDHPTVVRERGAALGQRINVVKLEGAPAFTGDTVKEAFVSAYARRELPPGLGFVQCGHPVSPPKMLPTAVDGQPPLKAVLPQLFREIGHSVRPFCPQVLNKFYPVALLPTCVITRVALVAEGRDVGANVVSAVRTKQDVMEMKAVRRAAERAFVVLEVK